MSAAGGGRADKLGNRYEGLWVVRQLLHLLAGDALDVIVEAVGDDERGVDVWVTRQNRNRDAQQCKRKNRSIGQWTVAELTQQGILQHLACQLRRDAMATFTFVSSHPAAQLRELADMARMAGGNATAYFQEALRVKAHAESLRRFCTAVGVNSDDVCGQNEAFDMLLRTESHLFEDSTEGCNELKTLARFQIDGDPELVIALLASFADERLGQLITAEHVRQHLREHDLPPRDLTNDPRAEPQVERLRQEFRDSLRPSLIQARLVPRPEAESILTRITSTPSSRLIMLHGRSGAGKSCVLLRLTELLAEMQIPYLPLRLDRRPPRTNANHYGIDGCGLPASPAIALRSICPRGPAVLILDQLDAVRWTTAHACAQWEACCQVIDEALALPDVVVIVACRTFDLRDDQQIKAWHHGKQGLEVEVGDLPEEVVVSVVNTYGGNFATLGDSQRKMLRSPLHLSLWVQIVSAGRSPGQFATTAELQEMFWKVQIEVASKTGVPGTEFQAALNALVKRMDQQSVLKVPQRTIEAYPSAAKALLSQSIVAESDRMLSFAHQSYFEYRLACQLVDDVQDGRVTVAQWLQASGQTLLRRDQLRLVLNLLQDEQPAVYASTLRAIVLAPQTEIRFHLRQLALRQFGESKAPRDSEFLLACELAMNSQWMEHVAENVLMRHAGWADSNHTLRLVANWLASADEREVNVGLQICRWWAKDRGEAVAGLVQQYHGQPEPWPNRLHGVLSYDPADDSPGLFAIRLDLIRSGVIRHGFMAVEEASKRAPQRVIDMLIAHFEKHFDSTVEKNERLDRESALPFFIALHDAVHFERVVDLMPQEFCTRLMPLALRVCEDSRIVDTDEEERSIQPFYEDSTWSKESFYNLRPSVELLRMLARAASHVISDDPSAFALDHSELMSRPGLSMQRMIGMALAAATENAADVAIGWLCDTPHRLELPENNTRSWGIAQAIICRHAVSCSDACYARLEQTILSYYSRAERSSYRWAIQRHRTSRTWLNNYGLTQHALLPSLPEYRLSVTARSQMGVLARKFNQTADNFVSHHSEGGFVSSAIRGNKAAKITDNGWLRIIGNPKLNARKDWHHGRSALVDTSAEGFARSFGEQANLNPSRFARLALRIPMTAYSGYLSNAVHSAAKVTSQNADCTERECATDDDVRALIEYVAYQTDERLASAFCWLMDGRHSCLTTARSLEIVRQYAIEHPHPAPDWSYTTNGEPDYDSISINCIRGKAIGVIGMLLWERNELMELFEPTIRQAAADPHPAVRVAAIRACLPILNIDRVRAIELVLAACDGVDEVLSSRWISEFLRYTLASHTDLVMPILRRMIQSTNPAVATSGAALLTAEYLQQRIAFDAINDLFTGSVAQRLGVAKVAASWWDDAMFRSRCVTLLERLVNDLDDKVREEAVCFLRHPGFLCSEEGRALTLKFVGSREFARDPSAFVRAIRNHTGSLLQLDDVMEAVCQQIAGALLDSSRRDQLLDSHRTYGLIPLLLRLYEQAEQANDTATRTRCLDWWDAMLQARLGESVNVLEQLTTDVITG